MKQFKSISLALFVLASLLGTEVSAQNIQQVGPANAAASAAEIKNLFGDLINVSAAQIETFYMHQWDTGNPYNSNCPHPEAKVEAMTNTDVTFEWDFFPTGNVDSFSISYLRLSDNTHDSFTTTGDFITVAVPHDLYLFVFQSKCGASRSALDIIIVERPIGFAEKNCDCPEFDLIWQSNFAPWLETPMHEWAPESDHERYYCEYDFQGGPYASFRAEIDFLGNTPQLVHLYDTCLVNMAVSSDNTFIFPHMPDDPLSLLGMTTFVVNANYEGEGEDPPVLSFAPNLLSPFQTGRIYLHKCKKRKTRKRNEQDFTNLNFPKNVTLKEISHSFDSNKAVEYSLPKEGSISIFLHDNQGRLLKTIANQITKEAGTYRQQVDLTGLPNGMFICILQTEGQSIPLRLVKTQ